MGGGIINSVAVAVDNVTLELNAGLLKIKDAGVAAAQLAAAVLPDWQLLTTLTFSGDSTKTTAALTAYKYYRIKGALRCDSNDFPLVYMRFNGDNGANYESRAFHNLTMTLYAAQTGAILGTVYTTQNLLYFESIFPALTPADALGRIFGIISSANVSGEINGTDFYWKGGNNTQISTITVLAANAMTGEVKVYGSN